MLLEAAASLSNDVHLELEDADDECHSCHSPSQLQGR